MLNCELRYMDMMEEQMHAHVFRFEMKIDKYGFSVVSANICYYAYAKEHHILNSQM